MGKNKYYVFLSCKDDIYINEYLFSMDQILEEEMNKGIIPERLKHKFENTDFPLSENSTITKEDDNKWAIFDEEKKKSYSVKKEKGELNIYKNECIEEFLNKRVSRNIAIECIKKHEDIKLAREKLDALKKSCIYVVDTHKDLDEIAYWELGYVMGKGITIIDFYDGKTVKKIPPNVYRLISASQDVEHFFERVEDVLSNLKPKESIFEKDWDKQQKISKKGPEAT